MLLQAASGSQMKVVRKFATWAQPFPIAVTLPALAGSGYFKGGFTGAPRPRSALLADGTAAAAALILAGAIS